MDTPRQINIDPNFDYIIKRYRAFLDELNLPAGQGWLVMKDPLLSYWEEKDSREWIKSFEKKIIEEEKEKIKKKILRQQQFKAINNRKRRKAEEITKLIHLLPIESQEYYKNKFKYFFVFELPDSLAGLSEAEFRKKYKEYRSDWICLEMHSAARKAEYEYEANPSKYIKSKSKLSFFMQLLPSIYDTAAKLTFAEGFPPLLKKARKGDIESFFKLLQIDRSIVEFEWALKLIRKAQLRGDESFFNQMAKAITTSPLENTRLRGDVSIILLSFWNAGLYRLSVREIADLLESCGMQTPSDTESFRKFIRRLQLADIEKELEPPSR